jgi:hypothetical protein
MLQQSTSSPWPTADRGQLLTGWDHETDLVKLSIERTVGLPLRNRVAVICGCTRHSLGRGHHHPWAAGVPQDSRQQGVRHSGSPRPLSTAGSDDAARRAPGS